MVPCCRLKHWKTPMFLQRKLAEGNRNWCAYKGWQVVCFSRGRNKTQTRLSKLNRQLWNLVSSQLLKDCLGSSFCAALLTALCKGHSLSCRLQKRLRNQHFWGARQLTFYIVRKPKGTLRKHISQTELYFYFFAVSSQIPRSSTVRKTLQESCQGPWKEKWSWCSEMAVNIKLSYAKREKRKEGGGIPLAMFIFQRELGCLCLGMGVCKDGIEGCQSILKQQWCHGMEKEKNK